MGNSRLKTITKSKLIHIVERINRNLDLLDLMINDMSNVTLNEINQWLEHTRKELDCIKEVDSKFELTENDKKYGTQLNFIDNLKDRE